MEIKVTDFTLLDESQIEKVLSWRNHPSVRAFSNSNAVITLEEHKTFVEGLRNDKCHEYYLVDILSYEGCGGGVFFFRNESGSKATVGLYKDVTSPMEKVGDMLMGMLLIIANRKQLKTINLNVHKNNSRALKLYERHGFRIVDDDNRSYYMEKHLKDGV